jgi:hypothetical protein
LAVGNIAPPENIEQFNGFQVLWFGLLDHAENTPSCSEQVQWRSDAVDTAGAATLSLSASWGEVGLEIKNLNATPSAPLVAGQQVAMHRASTW